MSHGSSMGCHHIGLGYCNDNTRCPHSSEGFPRWKCKKKNGHRWAVIAKGRQLCWKINARPENSHRSLYVVENSSKGLRDDYKCLKVAK